MSDGGHESAVDDELTAGEVSRARRGEEGDELGDVAGAAGPAQRDAEALDVLLLTGDLADAGESDCYDDLAAIFDDAARQCGASVVYLPGNHDDRDTFRRHLHGGAGSGPINQTHWRDGLRIIALDSTVPGASYGALDDQTLGYLQSEIETAAPDGTIVAVPSA